MRSVNNFNPLYPPPKGGFTLIELLTVIAVVGLLAALGFTGIRAAMRRSYQASAMANLHSLGQASALYTIDNKGDIFPIYSTKLNPAGTPSDSYLHWEQFLTFFYASGDTDLTKTRGDDFVQVAAPTLLRKRPADPRIGNQEIWWSYARNADLPKRASDPTYVDSPAKLNLLPFPARTLLLIEIRQSSQVYGSHPEAYFNFWESGPGGKITVLYVDGHVSRVSRAEIIAPKAQWTEAQRTFWHGYPDATSRRDY